MRFARLTVLATLALTLLVAPLVVEGQSSGRVPRVGVLGYQRSPLIDEFDRQWNPATILFESNAAFLGMKDLLTRHARFGPKLKSVTQSADKGARVAAFSVALCCCCRDALAFEDTHLPNAFLWFGPVP